MPLLPRVLWVLLLGLGVLAQQQKAGSAAGLFPRKLRAQTYFLGAIASLAALATRNFTTVFALIWIGSPVWGLRPTRALRCAFTKRPRPGTTNTPFFLVSLMAVSARFSKNAEAVLLLVSSFSARCRTSWVLVIPEAMNPPRWNFLDLLRCAPSYTSRPVEKQRLSRILCGFLHRGVGKGQERRGFWHHAGF